MSLCLKKPTNSALGKLLHPPTHQNPYIHEYPILICYRCDNHYVIPAETPEDKGKLVIEFEQEKGHENKMFIDEREKDRHLLL